MFDPQKILTQVLGGTNPRGNSGISPDLLKGGAIGGLAGILLGSKGGGKIAGQALKVGGMAVLGGLAYKAWTEWQANRDGGPSAKTAEMKDVTPQAEGTAFLPKSDAERDELGRTLLSAMIAAAKADGHIDAAEQTRIFQKLDQAGLTTEEKGFMLEELRKPLDMKALAAKATTPERALEIYAASLLAIDVDGTTERDYLQNLASELKLDGALTQRIEDETSRLMS